MKRLKDRIRSGETVYGCWINLGSTVSAEIIGQSGFDWVLVDLEHGAGNDAAMFLQLQALESTPAVPIVRIDDLTRAKVQRILDGGAYGIMYPQIQSADEANLAAQTMYYPPKGIRGVAKMVRATGFARNVEEYMSDLEKNIICIIQIETSKALDCVEDIAQLENVDILFVGPSDLTMSLGIFGQFEHPDFQRAIEKVATAAKKNGKASGVLLQDINEYNMYHKLGYRFIACGADSSFVAKGAAEMIKKMKSAK